MVVGNNEMSVGSGSHFSCKALQQTRDRFGGAAGRVFAAIVPCRAAARKGAISSHGKAVNRPIVRRNTPKGLRMIVGDGTFKLPGRSDPRAKSLIGRAFTAMLPLKRSP
jgi:hypothetical protein